MKNGETLQRLPGIERANSTSGLLRHIQNFAQEVRSLLSYLIQIYYQIPMAEEDVSKIAITTPFDMYEFPYIVWIMERGADVPAVYGRGSA